MTSLRQEKFVNFFHWMFLGTGFKSKQDWIYLWKVINHFYLLDWPMKCLVREC